MPVNRLGNQPSAAGFYYRHVVPGETRTREGLAGGPRCPAPSGARNSQEAGQGGDAEPKSPGNCSGNSSKGPSTSPARPSSRLLQRHPAAPPVQQQPLNLPQQAASQSWGSREGSPLYMGFAATDKRVPRV